MSKKCKKSQRPSCAHPAVVFPELLRSNIVSLLDDTNAEDRCSVAVLKCIAAMKSGINDTTCVEALSYFEEESIDVDKFECMLVTHLSDIFEIFYLVNNPNWKNISAADHFKILSACLVLHKIIHRDVVRSKLQHSDVVEILPGILLFTEAENLVLPIIGSGVVTACSPKFEFFQAVLDRFFPMCDAYPRVFTLLRDASNLPPDSHNTAICANGILMCYGAWKQGGDAVYSYFLKSIQAPACDQVVACSNPRCAHVEYVPVLVKPVFKACGNCKLARYCSTECQKIDWKNGHKTECQKLT